MKYLPILLILFGCESTTLKEPELHKYYIIIETEELSLFGDRYEPATKLDSVMCLNDSIAYHKGVIQYTASLRAENLLKKNKKAVGYFAKSFKVINEDGQDIKETLSGEYINQMDSFIKNNSSSK